MKKQKQRKKNKNKVWLIPVPKQLDKETREFVERNNSSISSFIRKSIRYLTEDEQPQSDGKRFVLWGIQLHPDLHKKAIELVKSNYPSKSSFVRYAVTRQLTTEKYLDEEMKTLLARNQVLKEDIAHLKKQLSKVQEEANNFAEAYFKVYYELQELKKHE
jgi:Arc/MetJ-type ribon-helix-helix transcriptional regulator